MELIIPGIFSLICICIMFGAIIAAFSKKFLLTYTSIEQLTRLAQDELCKVNSLLEVEIARQDWFSPTDFDTATSWKWLQVWKKHWEPRVTQSCPWIHFEYTLSWSERWTQISLDLESRGIVSRESIQNVAEHLIQSLSKANPKLFKGKGWLFRPTLEENRMVLLNRQIIDDAKFSAEWIFNTGKNLFGQISEIIPYIDNTVKDLFDL